MNATPARRMTRQRKLILEELRSTKSHPTADEIYAGVRRRLPRISLGTVYRNLQTLAADGEIHTLRDGGRTRYDGTMHEHYHVHCLVCGQVGDLPREAARDVGQRAGVRSDFRILGYKVEFVGVCPECERKGKEVAIGEENLSGYRRMR
ncbi:MAG: transcriptional repressor [Candidatus Glassbacteria bacterium]|nr:transcriptional repressor [Candidatus Glassbacteria bacterium]